jgi:hypothetical protein
MACNGPFITSMAKAVHGGPGKVLGMGTSLDGQHADSNEMIQG